VFVFSRKSVCGVSIRIDTLWLVDARLCPVEATGDANSNVALTNGSDLILTMETPHDPSQDERGSITPAQGEKAGKLEEGTGICLSGGGYRAMLFHVGALWRLNEVGVLANAKRISSVSGGSITAGWLALTWKKHRSESGGITPDAFRNVFAAGLRRLASQTIDIPSVLRGFVPWRNVGREIASAYNRLLFKGATLQDLPEDQRFVFNASNLQTGALWRFSRPYMGDWKVGRVMNPKLELATAVAASSAFPPFLSPIELQLRIEDYAVGEKGSLHFPPYTTRPVLSDGAVLKRYHTVLVSDGGAAFRPKPEPSSVWPFQLKRVLDCIDNQVRSLRKRDLMDSFETKQRRGCYWSVATPLSAYAKTCGLAMSDDFIRKLAQTPTRLARMDNRLQEQLINWGYAACTASLATNDEETPAPDVAWPYPTSVN
jgi:NTE family protein